MVRGRFVGIGVDEYTGVGLGELGHPVRDVTAVQALLKDALDGDILPNPTDAQAREFLRSVKSSFGDDGGVLVAMWSGHGVPAPANGGVRLIATDSDNDGSSGLAPSDLISNCALSDANQILLIVDTCYSGQALGAAEVATYFFAARPPGGRGAWVGVLASTSAGDTAGDGVFAGQLCVLLRNGPTDAELRRRWSKHNRRIRGDDLCDAVIKGWPQSQRQEPKFLGTGSAWEMVPNPLWTPDAPVVVVEHLLRAARGGSDPTERSWFTGRTVEVDEVVSWVTGGEPGVWVVTGSAGTGKSAILGRVVSASVVAERERLLAQNPDLGHADPGVGSVAAQAHARGVTVNRLADLLNQGLESSGVLARSDGGSRNGNELLGGVERAAQDHGAEWRAPVVVVDGLDEARDQAFDIASELLVRLGRWCTVIVSTRNLPAPTDTGSDLLDTLGPVWRRLDLDDAVVAARGREAIRRYVIERLGGSLW